MIVLYTKSGCPHCDSIKKLLNARQMEFNTIELGEDISREDLLEMFPTATTMPILNDLSNKEVLVGFDNALNYINSKHSSYTQTKEDSE